MSDNHNLTDPERVPEKKFKCSDCLYQSNRSADIQRHFDRNHKNKQYSKDVNLLVNHLIEIVGNHECFYCGKKFQSKGLLSNHVQSIHLGEKSTCPVCQKDISIDNF